MTEEAQDSSGQPAPDLAAPGLPVERSTEPESISPEYWRAFGIVAFTMSKPDHRSPDPGGAGFRQRHGNLGAFPHALAPERRAHHHPGVAPLHGAQWTGVGAGFPAEAAPRADPRPRPNHWTPSRDHPPQAGAPGDRRSNPESRRWLSAQRGLGGSRLRALTVDSVRRFMEASAVIAEALRDAGRGLAPEPDAGPGGPARTAGP